MEKSSDAEHPEDMAYVEKSLLLGYVETEKAIIGQKCHVRLLDQLRSATIIAESPYDPKNLALRA